MCKYGYSKEDLSLVIEKQYNGSYDIGMSIWNIAEKFEEDHEEDDFHD